MRRNALKNIRGGSQTWWVAIIASGFVTLFSTGYAAVAARTLVDAVGALILPCIVGSLFTILLAKHPRIAPHALDSDAMLMPWVIRLSMGLLTAGFVAMGVAAAMSGKEGGLLVAVVTGLFAAIFAFLIVRTWNGEFQVSGETFGIRLSEAPAEHPWMRVEPGRRDGTDGSPPEDEWPAYDPRHQGRQDR